LESEGHARADAFNAEGFTVLLPEMDLSVVEAVEAAAEYLSANWHPRLGVLAVGPACVDAARGLLDRGVSFDALALYGDLWKDDYVAPMPTLAHLPKTFDAEQVRRSCADAGALGRELEIYLYDDDLAEDAAELADARTLDMLEYLLS
jgi:hypothetical protein